MQLNPFTFTIRLLDPAEGLDRSDTFVLPVDSPDEEHAAAFTLTNAASFTTKMMDGWPALMALAWVGIESAMTDPLPHPGWREAPHTVNGVDLHVVEIGVSGEPRVKPLHRVPQL